MPSTLQRLLPVIGGIAFGLAVGLLAGRSEAPAPMRDGYADAVAAAAPAVVNIYTSKIVTRRRSALCELPSLSRLCSSLPERQERMAGSLGSGVVVREDGYVLTNNHVIEEADRVWIALADGREIEALVVGSDTETDLAVLRVPIATPQVVQVADDTALRVGDVVLAIGNPFGIGQTVSQGIVSALGRYGFFNAYEDFIQTDAAINPGNSGGALVDAEGRLVGLNTLIYSRSGGSQGIGFAIPASIALAVTDQIVENGEVVRGWLGVQVGPFSPLAEGLTVTEVTAGGPAERAGLRPGDLLVEFDEMPVDSVRAIAQRIAALAPGSEVALGVRRDGVERTLGATVGRRPVNG